MSGLSAAPDIKMETPQLLPGPCDSGGVDRDRARSRSRRSFVQRSEVIIVASEAVRRRSRQPFSRPKTVQFSLTLEEFDAVSSAAARSGLARGAFAAEVTLAAA